MSNLIPHKSSFKLEGKIVGLNNEKSLMSGTGRTGRPWRRLSFGIQTSPESTVFIELMGNVLDKAYAYNNKIKKSLPIDWKVRNEYSLPKGYRLIETDWDKIDRIINEFNEGDSVVVIGEIKYSEYNDEPQQQFVIKRIYLKGEEIDFKDENFKEVNKFYQELTVNGVELDKENKRVILSAFVIQNQGKDNPPDVQSTVFYSYADKNWMKTLSKFKFGDTLKVQGVINYKVIKKEVEQEAGWGKVDNVITSSVKELVITGGFSETYESKKYKESDFEEAFKAKQVEQEAKEAIGVEENKSEDVEDLPWMD